MVGQVGDDVFGPTLLENLRTYGVDTGSVVSCHDEPSGVALIEVDDAAENRIIVVSGANGSVGEGSLSRLSDLLKDAQVLLMQLEVPLESVVKAAKLAHTDGVMAILDPAPAQPLPPDLYAILDVITPNQSEAGLLVGFPVETPDDARRAAEVLRSRGVTKVIIKMGALGVYWLDEQGREFYPAFKVAAIDTIGAGDAFNGGFAAAIADGRPIREALTWGQAAGALSATKAGAQPSMPDRAALLDLIQRPAKA